MKKGDKVYVNFPSGEIECEYRFPLYDGLQKVYRDGIWIVPDDKIRPAEPEIEEGRLCKYTHKVTGEVFYGEYQKDVDEDIGKNMGFVPQPVHRRWNELSLTEKTYFTNAINNLYGW